MLRVLVVDDGSRDDTVGVARAAGAQIARANGTQPGHPGGKGNAMSTGLAQIHTPHVVFLDADVTDAHSRWIDALLGPLDADPETVLVKGHYRRHLPGNPDQGGRVNALLARPLLRAFAPELAHLKQPLAGEYAAKTHVLQELELEPDYAVEMGMLLDIAHAYGARSITQADLGTRTHRNRPLATLEGHADAILHAVLRRTGKPFHCSPAANIA